MDKESGLKILKRILHARSRGRPHSRYPANLRVYSPLVAPPTYGIFRRINQRILVPRVAKDLRRQAGPQPVVMAYTPTQTTLNLIAELRPRLTWYHCTSNYGEYPRTPSDIEDTERRLLELADVVTVDSAFLKNKHHQARPDIIHIESGVDFELFQQAYTGPSAAPVRTIYYFGAADDKRFDFDLVREVAQAGFSIRMLGTISDPAFSRVPGIEYLGVVPHKILPKYLRDADALIIPYKINAFSKGIFPAKTYECLATGKPVVATPLPDLANLSEHLYLAEGAEEFVRTLLRIPDLETPEKVHARIEVARENSWEARFNTFERILWQKI
jgi:glycosyltransferase involved in cell wall biosynthesis